MNTTSRALGFSIALGLTGIGVLAQEDPEPGSLEAYRATCARTQCFLSGEIVTGAPFSAEASIEWHPPAGRRQAPMRAVARYYRDTEGRMRVEQGFAGDARPPRFFLMPDTTERAIYVVDPVARTVAHTLGRSLAQMMIGAGGWNNFVIPLTPSRFISFFLTPVTDPEANGVAGEEPLGSSLIAGVQATGTRFSTQLPGGIRGTGRGERWVSPALKLVVYSRSEDAEIGLVDYRLTQIDRTEPRAELFAIPEDYDVVTPIATHDKGGLTWLNPYFPKLHE